jgi:hypothetical protein
MTRVSFFFLLFFLIKNKIFKELGELDERGAKYG